MHDIAKVPRLKGEIVGSFAYTTIKDRLPKILTRIIDAIHRRRHDVIASYGQDGSEDVIAAVGALSEMRYRLMTDKELLPITGSRDDIASWAADFEEEKALQDEGNFTWFKAPWLFIECYFYRKIASVIENSKYLTRWDPFLYQKEQAFITSLPTFSLLTDLLDCVDRVAKEGRVEGKQELLHQFMRMSLWANRHDLSLSAGEDLAESPLGKIQHLDDYILADDSAGAIAELSRPIDGDNRTVDIVLDNAGMEFVADLCLAEAILGLGLATIVRFHAKQIPWYVSDVTPRDFSWTLEMLAGADDEALRKLGSRLREREDAGQFRILVHPFWTSPHPFHRMDTKAPDLHKTLTESFMIIFKGDLNYRKLTRDSDWPLDTNFFTSCGGFHPAPFVALRTLKAEVVTGLADGVIEKLKKQYGDSKEWMVTGEYAVVQYFPWLF